VLWPVIVGRVLVRGSNRRADPGESILDDDTPITRLPFVPIGYALLAIGSIGLPFVRLIKSAICREREWLVAHLKLPLIDFTHPALRHLELADYRQFAQL